MKNFQSSPTQSALNNHWREYTVLVVVALLCLIAIYHQTAWSLIALWQSSETYAHGFIIYPISLYIIWRKRDELSTIVPKPSVLAVINLAVLGLGWMVAQSAGVQVVAQYMFVAMIVALTASVLGLRVVRALAFPLAFTLLAVPFGEIFIRPLIDFTANFTVFALQLSGIPVFREGNHFTIPSGSWSVVDACSGLRYLIASFTLGCLYAYLTYRSRLRQFIFIVLSIVVPIIANGLRAYMIVMIGHFSNMQLAVGFDHLIYGWVFFGLVMLILFWLGQRWREDNVVAAKKIIVISPIAGISAAASPLKAIVYATAALLLAWVSPAYLHHLDQQNFNLAPVTLSLPQTIGSWIASSPTVGLKPRFSGATATVLQEYRNGNQIIGIYIAFYRNQHNGAEAISSQNVVADEKTHEWTVTNESMRKLSKGIEPASVRQNRLRWGDLHLLAWQWYWIGNAQTANPYLAKFLQAKQRLMGGGDDSADIVIFTPYDIDIETATAILHEFISNMRSAIEASLSQAKNMHSE